MFSLRNLLPIILSYGLVEIVVHMSSKLTYIANSKYYGYNDALLIFFISQFLPIPIPLVFLGSVCYGIFSSSLKVWYSVPLFCLSLWICQIFTGVIYTVIEDNIRERKY